MIPVDGPSPDARAEVISVFDMLKVGVGPSSSHTLGPWRAAEHFVSTLGDRLGDVVRVRVELFGSLAKTGRGHGTGIAVMMGLAGHDPVRATSTSCSDSVPTRWPAGSLPLGGRHEVGFVRERDIVFDAAVTLDRIRTVSASRRRSSTATPVGHVVLGRRRIRGARG